MGKTGFIHCGDLHLGCQQFNDAQRWDDFRDAFMEIVSYAIEHRVEYFLIAGDLFHHRNVNAATLSMAMGALSKLKAAGIEVVAIEGNHDKALYLDEDSWMGFLNQQQLLKLLKPSFEEGRLVIAPYDGEKGCLLEKQDFRILGLGYLGATTRQRLEETAGVLEESGKFTLLLLHAAVDKLLGQDLAGVSHDSFEAFKDKVDYFALGHVHSRQEYKELIFNPGAPESVHIDEVRKNQEKGFYHIELEEGLRKVTFIPSARRQICYFDIDVTGVPTPALIADRVARETDGAGLEAYDKPLVQINLYGSIGFNSFAIDTGTISDMIKSRYSCLAVEVLNNTNLAGIAGNGDVSSFDRASVERFAISRMISEDKPEYNDFTEDLTNLVIKVKNYSLSDVGEDEIISAISQVLEDISLGEAAAAAEPGEDSQGGAEGSGEGRPVV